MKAVYFAGNLRAIVKQLGMTNIELVSRSGLTQAAVSQILAGKRDPSLSSIIRILKIIPIKFETLVSPPDIK